MSDHCASLDAVRRRQHEEDAQLHEPLPHAPLVLSQEYTAELGQPLGRIVERSDDLIALAIVSARIFVSTSQASSSRSAVSSNPALRSRSASWSTSWSGMAIPASRTWRSDVRVRPEWEGQRGERRRPPPVGPVLGVVVPLSLLGARLGCRLGHSANAPQRFPLP
jgi:hypothetical protein